MGNKTANKQERQRKKREQKRKIQIGLHKKGPNFGFSACGNQKAV